MYALTGALGAGSRRAASNRSGGFTLLELTVALAIAGLILAVSVPATMRIYDSMRYREAVRDVVSTLVMARYRAINSGVAQNVEIAPRQLSVTLGEKVHQLPSGMKLAVSSARELNRQDVGIIRFYPEGGSSGGGVEIQAPRGRSVRISVDWLMGGVTQEVLGDE